MVGPLLSQKMENRAGEQQQPSCPFWLKDFLCAKFFVPCPCSSRQFGRAVESNLFCVDCARVICPQCSSSHIQHHILQIRRSSYQNVVRIIDAQNYLDTTAIQPYVINGSKVVFLRERPQSRFTNASNPCNTCGRNLLLGSQFCSIACKYEWVMSGDTGFSMQPREDAFMSTDSHQPVFRNRKKRKHQQEQEQAMVEYNVMPLLECNATEKLPKLAEVMSPSTPPRSSGCCGTRSANRRKGIPHRAPLGV